MDDDEYLGSLMERAGTTSVAEYSWRECIEGFKQADRDMGSAFHRKLDWMNRAADTYLAENNKMAGFVEEFAGDTGVVYSYASQLNRVRKTFSCRDIKNFSANAANILLSAPKELQEDFLSSDEKVTKADVEEAKKGYKQVTTKPTNSDLKQAVDSGTMRPTQAAKEANRRANQAVADFNSMSDEEKVHALGGEKKLSASEQRKLDETVEEDFNPYSAALAVLTSLSRLSIHGGRESIEQCIMERLMTSPRMQKYEAEGLILLAEMVNDNYETILSLTQTKPELKVVN